MNCPETKTIHLEPVRLLLLASLALLFSSCLTQHRTFTRNLPDGTYRVKEDGRWKKAIVYNSEDTSLLLIDTASAPVLVADFLYTNGDKQQFIRRSFDLDVFSFPVKLRPSRGAVPRQLNTHINGNLYVGYRTDHYLYGKKVLAPGAVQRYRQRVGYGVGAFAGLGSVFINPTFLRNAIDYEYDGVVLTYGAAVVMGYGKVTTGLGVGFDFLTDRYRGYWIYQNKPWLGLVIGLHLN